MLKDKEIAKLDKELENLERLIENTILENELIKINIKKKELLLKRIQLNEMKDYN
ncbi:MAG: hypothetical protein ACI4OP_07995 [Candidatus Coprovivens sp.]